MKQILQTCIDVYITVSEEYPLGSLWTKLVAITTVAVAAEGVQSHESLSHDALKIPARGKAVIRHHLRSLVSI
jgi:hypothetical protein